MFSSAMYTMESAISASMSGGNQSASGASPIADAMSVIECATVNDVMMATSGLIFLNGMTRQKMNSRWSMPFRMCANPSSMNRSAA